MNSKLEGLEKALILWVAPDELAFYRSFARQMYSKAHPLFLEEFDQESLIAILTSAVKLLEGKRPHEIKVRVSNPSYHADGWESPYTAVELALTDRPFLVDSVTHELKRMGLSPHHVVHPVLKVGRDEHDRLLRHAEPTRAYMEAYELFLVERVSEDQLRQLEERVSNVLLDVKQATDDYLAMRRTLGRVSARTLSLTQAPIGQAGAMAAREALEFLEWMDKDNFVYLAYSKLESSDTEPQQAPLLRAVPSSALGLASARMREVQDNPVPLSNPPDEVMRVFTYPLICVSRSEWHSTVHRPGKMDRILVKELDYRLNVVREHCFLGLFTSSALCTPVKDIPILRNRLQKVLELDRAVRGSHDYKQIVSIFNSIPREELFWAQPAQLHRDIRMIMAMQREDEVRVTVRPDPMSHGVLVMVVIPNARYSADVRYRVQQLLLDVFHAKSADFQLSIGEDQEHARLHFFLSSSIKLSGVDMPMLQAKIVELTRTWQDELNERLISEHGGEGGRLSRLFASVLPDGYTAQTSPELAIRDIGNLLLRAEKGQRYLVAALPDMDGADSLQANSIRIYHGQESLILSEVLPMLENLGLRVLGQSSYKVPFSPSGQERETTIDIFRVQNRWTQEAVDLRTAPGLLAALDALLAGELENRSLNALIVSGSLSWRQVDLLASYQAYLSQVAVSSSSQFIGQALLAHPKTAALLYESFETKFCPHIEDRDDAIISGETRFLRSLEEVSSLAFDGIFRALFGLVRATVRTNFFLERSYISHKIRSSEVLEMPSPRPLFEIIVVGSAMEGVHLRGGMVARGGLRWSDRPDDYRTEVLGLMKTQMTKNSVIVPVGSKGGFVLKHPPTEREALGRCLAEQYKTFIRGLLDLTDNNREGQIVHPEGLVIYDGPDPYLVVAADKGTAKFSDTANAVAAEYDFWLGDAFASGGSFGYHHKKEGITARGAWECAKRHFHELDVDVHQDRITCVAIGDMSGDVFGNGMLYTDQLLLKAAFNHQHIFLDPAPDPGLSYAERKRLFALPYSGWSDYDKALISSGGGVFSRSAKAIPLSPEVMAMLGTDRLEMSGPELVRSVLRMPVDLLWNGGIGTYVRASHESDASAADSSNDTVRISASELRARVVGEGGNGGFTQAARVEYALAGGRINTDAIDNSAGVDMSDHEVNIKMLLQSVVSKAKMTLEERNQALASMTAEVTEVVLENNFWQALCLSMNQRRSREDSHLLLSLQEELAVHGFLDPASEHLPEKKTLEARGRVGAGYTRPELAVLLAYTKMHIYRQVLGSSLPEEPQFQHYLQGYFPSLLRERHSRGIETHSLRREILATEITNVVVNLLGSTFVHQTMRDTGTTAIQVLRAVLSAMEILQTGPLLRKLTRPEEKLPASALYDALSGLAGALEDATRWFLLNDADLSASGELLEHYRQQLEVLRPQLLEVLPESQGRRWIARRESLEASGLSKELARTLVFLDHATSSLCIAGGARRFGVPVLEIARRYHAIGSRLKIGLIRDRLRAMPAQDRWSGIAVAGLIVDLRRIQLKLSLVEIDLSDLPGHPLERFLQLLGEVETEDLLDQSRGDVLARMLGQVAEAAHRQVRLLAREQEQWQQQNRQPRHSKPRATGALKRSVNW